MECGTWRLSDEVVVFSSKSKEYSWLSTMFISPFNLDGRRWPAVENYFQAAKFFEVNDAIVKEIAVVSPFEAKRLGSKRGNGLRSLNPEARAFHLQKWDQKRDSVMMAALRARYYNDKKHAQLLIATGSKILVHYVPGFPDKYWGCDEHGKGQNVLGVLLMQVRSEVSTVQK